MTRRRGFTLLELLVSLVVLGLLLAGLEQAFQFGLAVSKTTDQNIRRTADLESTDRALRNLLSHISPAADGSNGEWAFRGTPTSLSFFGVLPDGVATERHAEMTIFVNEDHHLVLRWRPAPHLLLAQPPPYVVTDIVDRMDRLELSYGPSASARNWASSWSGGDPPKLIRAVIESQDKQPWPAIIISVPFP